MKKLLPCLVVLICTSGTPAFSETKSEGWAELLEDRSVSRYLAQVLRTNTLGSSRDWAEVSRIWRSHALDGIAAECFGAGMGQLFLSTPSTFLDRYLDGDR